MIAWLEAAAIGVAYGLATSAESEQARTHMAGCLTIGGGAVTYCVDLRTSGSRNEDGVGSFPAPGSSLDSLPSST